MPDVKREREREVTYSMMNEAEMYMRRKNITWNNWLNNQLEENDVKSKIVRNMILEGNSR